MRYAIALQQGGWVVRDAISGQAVTPPATSEEAQQAVAEWNAGCVTRQVDPPVKVDGWGAAGELKVGCSRRMVGGVSWLAVMEFGGYAPRISVDLDPVSDGACVAWPRPCYGVGLTGHPCAFAHALLVTFGASA